MFEVSQSSNNYTQTVIRSQLKRGSLAESCIGIERHGSDGQNAC